jgi:hypothetical protein
MAKSAGLKNFFTSRSGIRFAPAASGKIQAADKDQEK